VKREIGNLHGLAKEVAGMVGGLACGCDARKECVGMLLVAGTSVVRFGDSWCVVDLVAHVCVLLMWKTALRCWRCRPAFPVRW
jgi:hypothetical protein